MSYQKQTFTSGDVFYAAELAHIEAGVAANDAKATELTARANALAAALDDATGWESYDETQTGRKRSSDNSYASLGVGMQDGETLRIRNLQITQIGNSNNGSLYAFYIWGYPDAVFGASTEHTQLMWKNAAAVAAGGVFSATAGAAYGALGIATNAKDENNNEVTETFRIQFEYKIAPAASAGQSAAGTYTPHGFQDGNDLYPDELDDMENQIVDNDTALDALKIRLDSVAAAVGELIPWRTFNQTFTGSKLMEVPVIAGQVLKIRNLNISLENNATPTAFIIKGCNSTSYNTDPGTQLVRKSTFEDFQFVLDASYSYLRVNAVAPNAEEQTVSFEYKIV